VLLLALAQLPLMFAAPVHFPSPFAKLGHGQAYEDPDSPSLWLYLGVATALVLSGGVFAGLTIALMGQVGEPGRSLVCRLWSLT
jgi:metal transporter CNNM